MISLKKLFEQDVTAFVKTKSGKQYAISSTEKELQNLKKDPDISDIETDKGRTVKEVENTHTEEDIRLLGQEVSKALTSVLESMGDEVLTTSVKVDGAKFSIEVIFKGDKEDTFSFYTQGNNLYFKGSSYDIELGEFIITPGEKVVINKSLVIDKLTNYFRETYMEENKKAKKDYDKDGRIETPEEEYLGSKAKAIKKSMKKEETFDVELRQDPKTKEFSRRIKLTDKDKETLKKIQALLNKEKESKSEITDYQKRREAEKDYKKPTKDVPPQPYKEPKNDYFARRKKELEYRYGTAGQEMHENSQESGLIVVGRTPLDNSKIGEVVEELELYAEWNSREGYWFFPEDEETYDQLEMLLTQEFDRRGIIASFEGLFENVSHDNGGDLDVGHQDDEPDMLKQYIYDIAVYAAKLYKQLHKYDKMEGEVDFPNWWQAKIIKARDNISAAQHYLEFEEKQPALDAMALEEQKATCCGRCGRVHVKGTPCKKPYLSKSDPKHCQNK